MCSNYRRAKSVDEIAAEFTHLRIPLRFAGGAIPNLPVQDEIRPTDQAAIVRLTDDGPELVRMRWGLVPFQHRGPLKAFKLATFNARAETVATSPTFRAAFRHRRALVVADGWAEWKGEGKPKPKFYIDRADGRPIAFAGLWERCRPSDGDPVESFTIVTGRPGALGDVHDRAPVVLPPGEWLRWLDPGSDVADLLTAEPPDEYRVRPFSQAAEAWTGVAPVSAQKNFPGLNPGLIGFLVRGSEPEHRPSPRKR